MEKLLVLLKNGGNDRYTAQEKLYKKLRDEGCVNIIYRSIEPYRGTLHDAEDLFQEAYLVLIKKLDKGEHQNDFNTRNYLVAIARNLWKNTSRANKVAENYQNKYANDASVSVCCDEHLERREKRKLIDEIIGNLTDQCKEILKLWMEDFSMREIAEKLDLSSERLAIKYKYRCHKRLVKYLAGRPNLVNELNN
ncbi:MAG: sigma-70 family RNA polymerase sigma factor [Saprospirales bacterium]|nr:MAG: sigma-70 family RNA polymerase sigma factor [Saprospirales bacterium]